MTRTYALRASMRVPLLEALAVGATYRDACGKVGIPWPTWCRWSREVTEGTCNDPDVVELVLDARKAYASASVSLHAVVRVAAQKNWKAAAWQLEHRRGDPKARHDAKRARYEAEVAKARAAGTHVDRVSHETLTDAELDERIRRLSHAGAAAGVADAVGGEGVEGETEG